MAASSQPTDDQELLGLQRAEFEKAKRYARHAAHAQAIVAAIAAAVVIINRPTFGYAGAVTGLLVAVVWLALSIFSRRLQHTAERARRILLLSTGLGVNLSGKAYSDLFSQFSSSAAEGVKHQDAKYFTQISVPGYHSLAKLLSESAFWSKNLYGHAGHRAWWRFTMYAIVCLILLFIFPLLKPSSWSLKMAQIVCIALTWIVTGSVFREAYSLTVAARAIDDVEGRIESMMNAGQTEHDLLVLFGDYNAIVQDTPLIPTNIYENNKDSLNALWKGRQRDTHITEESD